MIWQGGLMSMRSFSERRGLFLVALVVWSAAVSFRPATAGENTWTSTGPEGGEVRSLAAHPWDSSTIFAGTIDGVYMSSDAGHTWQRSSRGIESRTVWSIVIDPENPDLIVALTWGRGGLFWSHDGGDTWVPHPFGKNRDVRYLESYGPQFIVVVIDEGRAWVSRDGCATWNRVAYGVGEMFDLVIHPERPQRMFALLESGGAVVSDNSGSAWRECPLPNGHEPTQAVFDPHDPDIVYLPADGFLARTDDWCESWQVEEQSTLSRYGFFEADPHRDGTVYATGQEGLRRSPNGGGSWHQFGPQSDSLWSSAISISPVDGDVMFLAADAGDERRGVFRSGDGGGTWPISTTGLNIRGIGTIDVDPSNPSIVYAGTSAYERYSGGGIFKSVDSGGTWSLLEDTEEAGPIIVLDPLMPSILFASAPKSTIVKSTDRGETWFEVWPGFDDNRIEALETDPHRSGTLFAVVGRHQNLHRSVDGGVSWTRLSLPEDQDVMGVYCHPRRAGVVFAVTYDGLNVSTNWGETWNQSSIGLEVPGSCFPWWCPPYYHVQDLAFDPSNPDVMYAATDAGPFRSTDGGSSWELFQEGMLICCEYGSWSEECYDLTKAATSGPLRCEGGPLSMAVDPDRPHIVYATTVFGTYRGRGRGVSWERIDRGVETRVVHDLIAVGGRGPLGASSTSSVLNLEVVDPPPRRPALRRLRPSPRRH